MELVMGMKESIVNHTLAENFSPRGLNQAPHAVVRGQINGINIQRLDS